MRESDIRNVFLITVDSLRFDHVQNEDLSTLYSEANDVTSFAHAFATGPGTTPSFPGLLTGTLPLSYGGLGPLTDDRPRVAQQLQQGQINTAGFQCNPFLSENFNYQVGFETFEDYQNPLMGIATKVFPRGIEINNPRLEWIDEVFHFTDALKKSYQMIKGKPRPYVSAEVITDDTINWLSEAKEPFFCWTHYMDVHHPCFPPERYRHKWDVGDVSQTAVSNWYSALLREPETLSKEEIDRLRRLYDAAIEYVDDQIQRIFNELEKRNILEDTCVIVTSDHGELFGDYDQYGKPERMYDELLRVPLLITNGPEYLEAATDQLVSLLDVPPVIHDVLGIKIPSEYEGRRPGVDEPRTTIIGEHEVEGSIIVGARSKSWLFEGDEIRNEHRLFDLREGAVKPVPVDHPKAAEVRSTVLNRLETLDIDHRALADEVDGDIEERLESLGYL